MKSRTDPLTALFLILCLAALLRLVGIGFGPYHPDEHLILNHSLAFGTGDLNPHLFYFPSFFMYILFGVYGVFYLLGLAVGKFHGPDDLLALYLVSPQAFYVLGRVVSACFGAATVALAYFLGKSYKNARTGSAAALFLAVNFLHVRDSHFATMDIALTFFMSLSLFFLMSYSNERKKSSWRLAAFTAGMAAAVKYNGFILAVPIAAAYLLINFPGNWKAEKGGAVRALFLDGAKCALWMLAGFFLFSPYVILDWRSSSEFIRKLYELNRAFDVSWAAHARMLYFALGQPLLILSIVGLSVDLWRAAGPQGFSLRPRPSGELTKFLLLLSYFVAYYVMITRAGQPFERYVLPLVPVCVAWAASLVDRVAGIWRRVAVVLCGFLAMLSLSKSLYSNYLFLQKDTRDLAREWIHRHVPDGSVIVIADPGQSPKLAASPEQIREKLALLKEGDSLTSAKRKRLEGMLALEPYPSPSYNLYYLTEERPKAEFVFLGPLISYRVEALEEAGADYLVAPAEAAASRGDFFKALEERADRVVSFDPRRDTSQTPSSGWTYSPIDGSLWNCKRPGPLLTIYRIRSNKS